MSTFALDSMTAWGRALSALEIASLFDDSTGLDFPFAGGPFTLVYQAALINDPPTPFVLGSGFQLWTANRFFDGTTSPGTFEADMSLLFTGVPSTQGYPWIADSFLNNVVFAQHDNVAQFWTPPLPAVAQPIPGLPVSDDKWDGVTVFFDHVLLWRQDILKWSDRGDMTIWIPISQTVVSTVLNVIAPFVQPTPGGTVTITVSNPAVDVPSVSLSLSAFTPSGSIAVGSTATAILTIDNTGTIPLVISGVSVPAGFSSDFSGTESIPVGGSAPPVVITFAPLSAINYTGIITVAVPVGTLGTNTIPITGTGTGTTKSISLSGLLSFGQLFTGHSESSSLIIANGGNTTLSVTSITLPTGFTGSFAGTIAAGAKHAVSITFSPTALLTYGGDVSVASDATDGSPLFPISGQGVHTLNRGIFLTDNGTLQFDTQDSLGNVVGVTVGSTPTGTLRIYNPGSLSMHVLGIAYPGGFSGPFVGTIAAHSFHDVTVTFSPLAGIFYGGLVSLALANPVTDGSTFISVEGTGIASGKVIALSGNLDYGDVLVGSSVTSILTIKNTGDTNLTVTSISYPTGFSGAFAGVILPGSFRNVFVTFNPVLAITYSGTLTVNSDKTSGTPTFPVSGTGIAIPVPESLQPGQFVSIADGNGGFNFFTVVSQTGGRMVLQSLPLTGATPSGTTVLPGVQLFTIDANEAGETRVVGSVNGPIWRVSPQGDYAYIYKERSISSIQYTGLGNGTFFIHPEVSGEGLLGRNAFCSINDGRMIFLGHKELYQYQGGPNLTPVCQQFTRQLYRELDRTRIHQILLFNNELFNEVWVSYPVTAGGFRVLIWNYLEDTASIDDYDNPLLFTAFGLIDWSADPTWSQFADSTTWASLDAGLTWNDMVGISSDHLTVMASQDGNLRIWGTEFSRDGEPYRAVSESMDYDLGDGDAWKYVDVVKLGLRIQTPDDTERLLWIQVGARADLNDGDILWTDPVSVLANGHAAIPVKVNPGGAGRYLRVRFFSQDVDVKWAISSFEILARMGSTY